MVFRYSWDGFQEAMIWWTPDLKTRTLDLEARTSNLESNTILIPLLEFYEETGEKKRTINEKEEDRGKKKKHKTEDYIFIELLKTLIHDSNLKLN